MLPLLFRRYAYNKIRIRLLLRIAYTSSLLASIQYRHFLRRSFQ